ncbi:uncharacterized protein LOC125946870 [Dermacentor silvarum]|uniref:uncharacterized protein LOC125946870 n=1 Tax=Dermacentor silvarum TaxID=543639 RepID=UPI0021006BA4|nr:uncharacterized protein LOC125946870 [Dermacentor silvarum]
MHFASDCLYGIPKIAAGLTLSAFDDNTKSICKVGSEQHEAYRKAVGCMNSVGTKINACLKGFHSLVQRAVVKAQAKHVIGHACCSYHDALDCLRNALTPCDSAGSIEFATGLLGKVFGETLHLVCGEHTEGSEACKTLPEVPKLGPRDRKIDNYVELLVEVASKVGRQK